MNIPERQVRAVYDEETITVYQAFNQAIAQSAVQAQRFVSPPFKMERMTWIKPSFLWMMYRSGWGRKENQECVLAVRIKRSGLEWALANSCLSHFDSKVHGSHEDWKAQLKRSPVRIQWDPEKDIYLQPLPYKSLQVGLSGKGVELYVNEWIVDVEDISKLCRRAKELIKNKKMEEAKGLLPKEDVYPVPSHLQKRINYSMPL